MEAYRKRYKKCVVPGCTDILSKRHTFPRKDISLFNKWVQQVQNQILDNKSQEQIYKCHMVCDLHFAAIDKVLGTKRGLRKTAFPTLLLPHSNETSSEVDHHEDPSQGPSISNIHSTSGEHMEENQFSVNKPITSKLKLILSSSSFEGVQKICRPEITSESFEESTTEKRSENYTENVSPQSQTTPKKGK